LARLNERVDRFGARIVPARSIDCCRCTEWLPIRRVDAGAVVWGDRRPQRRARAQGRRHRRIFDNIRKFIRYAMTGNSAEIWVLFLALAAEPGERGLMRRPPRPPTESVFAHGLWQHALLVGILIAGLCLACAALVTAAVEAEKAWRRRPQS
jgi:Cation transporting ATPase, C-terminus